MTTPMHTSRAEFSAFSRLDWPAFELLRDVEKPRARASDEALHLNWSALQLLCEARLRRADTRRRLFLRLVHELREFMKWLRAISTWRAMV